MDYIKEKQEAIDAGKRALECLERAKGYLTSAKNWGLFDTFFKGGFISGLIKHSKMSDAGKCIKEAKECIQVFNSELNDISLSGIVLDTGDILGIVDILFDNVFADIMMQQRIADAYNQIDDVMIKIENILRKLENE